MKGILGKNIIFFLFFFNQRKHSFEKILCVCVCVSVMHELMTTRLDELLHEREREMTVPLVMTVKAVFAPAIETHLEDPITSAQLRRQMFTPDHNIRLNVSPVTPCVQMLRFLI